MRAKYSVPSRLTLYRDCGICGNEFSTTADSPFKRRVHLFDGGALRHKTIYYCSRRCKAESYKHKFDGLAWLRKRERDAMRDTSEKNKRYYAKCQKPERERLQSSKSGRGLMYG